MPCRLSPEVPGRSDPLTNEGSLLCVNKRVGDEHVTAAVVCYAELSRRILSQ